MIEESRFWIFLMILFVCAYITAETAGRIRGKQDIKRFFYGAAALTVSIGIWLNLSDVSSFGAELFHFGNLIALVLGVLIGLFPYLIFIPLLIPLLLSLLISHPLKPLFEEDGQDLGTLTFLPSGDDQLTMVWDDGETETLIRLQGEKAALSIMSCRTRPAFFFLKDQYHVLGVASESVSPASLSELDENIFHTLGSAPERAEKFFDIHYPAPRFLEPGYFYAWSFSVRNGEISVRRK